MTMGDSINEGHISRHNVYSPNLVMQGPMLKLSPGMNQNNSLNQSFNNAVRKGIGLEEKIQQNKNGVMNSFFLFQKMLKGVSQKFKQQCNFNEILMKITEFESQFDSYLFLKDFKDKICNSINIYFRDIAPHDKSPSNYDQSCLEFMNKIYEFLKEL